jgi:hypothetical protein
MGWVICKPNTKFTETLLHKIEDILDQKYPELELDRNNLITLCESKSKCHWIIGHLLNWRSYNPNAKEDALAFREKLLARPIV